MIYFEDYVINSADLGDYNPLPDIKNVSYIHAGYEMTDRITEEESAGFGKGMISTILPYKIQDGYNRNRKPRVFKAVRLENKYLRAIFLPELGGRLWSLYDKIGDKELLYKNTVFQPANLALRNAWFSGGIEFNVGIKGHNPLTCSPLFAEILDYGDNGQALKMYEFERIREISYSVTAYLPEDSKLLYIREQMENTSDEEKYAYWWSNIAVPETGKTRVIVPAKESFLSSYNEGQYLVDKISIPMHGGRDVSYPKSSVCSQDFFYKIPQESAKWIAAVQCDGHGLIQVSDRKMIGRKLFVWGQGAGGRNWGEWLSEKGQSYVEIQAGLAYTQLEHLPMKAHESWQWTEGYGAVYCEPRAAYSTDWETAQNAVKTAFDGQLENAELEERLASAFPPEEACRSRKKIYSGSGWGAVENILRQKQNKKPVSDNCEYPADSIGEEQESWLYLLENGVFPPTSPAAEPASYVSGKIWRSLLLSASQQKGNQQWYALLQLGVHYYIYNEVDKAKQAFEESITASESCWAWRNLAMLYKNEYHITSKAIECIEKAVELNSSCRGILVECAVLYTDNGLDSRWLALYSRLSSDLQRDGRIKLYKAIAHINLAQIDDASRIVNDRFQMCDIQEGEVSVSKIWKQLYTMKVKEETGLTDNDEAQRQAEAVYPLPWRLDFRMHE